MLRSVFENETKIIITIIFNKSLVGSTVGVPYYSTMYKNELDLKYKIGKPTAVPTH